MKEGAANVERKITPITDEIDVSNPGLFAGKNEKLRV
jgi:hypothetical protein